MEKFGKFVVNTLLVSTNLALTMFTLSYLWLWFVVPLGVPAIGWAHAFGLSLIVVFFQVRNKPMWKPELFNKVTIPRRLGLNIGFAAGSLLIGYITSLFM